MFLVSMNVSNFDHRLHETRKSPADDIADMGSNVGGSNIAASKAATLHQEWVTNLGGQYLIGSPAVARGSKKWMDVSAAGIDGTLELIIRTGLLHVLASANLTLSHSTFTEPTSTNSSTMSRSAASPIHTLGT